MAAGGFIVATALDWRLVTWQVPGRTVTISAELSFEKGQPIFQLDFMALGQCVRLIPR